MKTQIENEKLQNLVKNVRNISKETHRENANVGNNFSAKLLQIASSTNKVAMELEIPQEFMDAHNEGAVHIHDLDAYNLTVNCLQLDTGEALRKGFNTGYGTLNAPKRIESAASLSCILLQSSQNDMFGGQSHYNFDNDLATFVAETRQRIQRELQETIDYTLEGASVLCERGVEKLVEKRVRESVAQAMQVVVCNLNSMHSRAGSQIPFSSLNLGVPLSEDAALVCEEFLKEYDKGLGKGEQPVFPNIIFRVKKGVNANPEDPYYYLFQLACEVAANRMNPTFINCDSSVNLPFYEKGVLPATMGCRTRVCENINGPETPAKRGNIAPISMNLPRLAIDTIYKDKKEVGSAAAIQTFFNRLDALLDLCERQLLHRYDVLKGLKGKDLPFIISQELIMGAEEIRPEDSIEPILKQGSWGIGWIGLAETLICLTGKHHGESEEAQQLGYEIVSHIYDFCKALTIKHQLNFSNYATPGEGLAGRFTALDLKKYGAIKDVTDHGYYTNSFHVPVTYPISIMDKLKIEGVYHKLCPAGHISYVELDETPVDHAEVVERIIRYAFNETEQSYMGINFGIRYCRDCGQNHVHGSLCPECQSANIQGVYRVTGYLSLEERFGGGKAIERQNRISHS